MCHPKFEKLLPASSLTVFASLAAICDSGGMSGASDVQVASQAPALSSWPFNTFTLRNNCGRIGQVLRQLPPEVLSEAEKQSEPWNWLADWVKTIPLQETRQGPESFLHDESAVLEKAGFKRTETSVYSSDPATRHNPNVYQGVREVRFDFPKDEPGKVLMRIVMDEGWLESIRKTFEAAASQRQAILRLVEIARGGGSISDSSYLMMREAFERGDSDTANYYANRVVASILKMEKGKQWLLDGGLPGLTASPEVQALAQRKYDTFYTKDARKLGRTKADEKWKATDDLKFSLEFKFDTVGQKIITPLAFGWLSVDGREGWPFAEGCKFSIGFPGFCFISDKILATILGLTLPFQGLLPPNDDPANERGRKSIEDHRMKVGLKKAEPFVTGLKNVGGRRWVVLGERGNEVGSFVQASSLPPKLTG